MRILTFSWPWFLYFTLGAANSTITVSTMPDTGPEWIPSIITYGDLNYGHQDGDPPAPLSTITYGQTPDIRPEPTSSTITYGQTIGFQPDLPVSIIYSGNFHQESLPPTSKMANTWAASIALETPIRPTPTRYHVADATVTITTISIITPHSMHSQSTFATTIVRHTVPVVPVPTAIESGSAQGDETQDVDSPGGSTQVDPGHPSFQPPVQVVPIQEKPSKWWEAQWVTIATWVLGMYVIGSGIILGWFWARGCIDTTGSWNNRHRPLSPSPQSHPSPRPANYLDTTYQEQWRQQQPRFTINRISHIPRAHSRVPVQTDPPVMTSTPLSPPPPPPSPANRRLRHPSFFGTVVPPLPPFTFPPPPRSVHQSRSNATLNARHPPLQPQPRSPTNLEYAHLTGSESTTALNTDYPRMPAPSTMNASSSHSVNGHPSARSVSIMSFRSSLSSDDEMAEWTGNRIMHDLERMGVY